MKKTNNHNFLPFLTSTVCFLLCLEVAQAQDVPLTNVYDYNRSQYDSKGMHVGAFEVDPTISASSEWNDNIYASESNKSEDIIMSVTPAIKVKSLWSRHSVSAQASVVDKTYLDHSSEDHTDVNLSARGSLDLTSSSKLFGGVSYSSASEERDSIENLNSLSPTEYTSQRVNIGFKHNFNRMFVTLNQAAEFLDYDDVALVGGGIADNDDRDRATYTFSGRLGYALMPGYSAFVETVMDKVEYDNPNVSEDRDSTMTSFNTGVQFELASKMKGEAYVGYLSREYDQSNFSADAQMNFGGSILWSITPITSFEAKLARAIKETTDVATSGYIETALDMDLQHELRRNILLRLKSKLSLLEYNGSSDQSDSKSVQLEGKYLLSPRLSSSLNMGLTKRDSDRAGETYERAALKLNVRYSFY